MRRRHLAAAAALSVLLAAPVAANAATTSPVKVRAGKSVVAGSTLRVAVGATVPTSQQRARRCTVRLAGVKNVDGVASLGLQGKNRIAKVAIPRTLKPARYKLIAACGGITKRGFGVVRVLPPGVTVTAKLLAGSPKLQGSLGTTSYAWAAQVTNADPDLDAYSVTVRVEFTAANGIPVVATSLIRRLPAGTTVTVGNHEDLAAGSAAITGVGAFSATARFGLAKTGQPLPIVTPASVPLSKTIVSGVTTGISVDKVQVNSPAPALVTRRSWITFFDAAGGFVGAAEQPRTALAPGANTLNFAMSGVNVPQDAVTASITYEG